MAVAYLDTYGDGGVIVFESNIDAKLYIDVSNHLGYGATFPEGTDNALSKLAWHDSYDKYTVVDEDIIYELDSAWDEYREVDCSDDDDEVLEELLRKVGTFFTGNPPVENDE